VQAGVILCYTAIITIWLPQYWLHPFGPVLKNLPILLLLWLLHRYGNETA
jgi:DoxX-like family